MLDVGSGPEALILLGEDRQIGLMLTDFAMPGMTGRELSSHAQALRPTLRVLLMTGYADPAALPAEAVQILRKPFAMGELAAAVAAALSQETPVIPFRRPETGTSYGIGEGA